MSDQNPTVKRMPNVTRPIVPIQDCGCRPPAVLDGWADVADHALTWTAWDTR
jgi:hypothetical protein